METVSSRVTIDSKADLLLHPVRIRIVQAFSLAGGSRRLTVQELGRYLADVPQTTLYRQVRALYRGGVLAIASSRRVRGTQEQTYVLAAGAGAVRPDDLASASEQDHLRYFNAFIAGLAAQFAHYLRRPSIDLRADGVGYRSVVLNLSDEDLIAMSRDLSRAMLPYLRRDENEGRRPRLFATVLMPMDGPAAAPAESDGRAAD